MKKDKDKEIFLFRKHPAGDFLDGKKERKQKEGRLRGANVWAMRHVNAWGMHSANARKVHRALGILLSAAVLFNTLPASGFAVSASEQERGLCEHHRSHTAECGYAEAQPCTHEHTDECYKTVTECVHTHTDECYPETEENTGEGNAATSDAESREPSNCTHECKSSETGLEESGCITKVLDCHHEHDESCGYQEAQKCGYVCEICNGTEPETENTGDDTENNIENDTENNTEDTDTIKETENKKPEDTDTNLCAHHREHTADCGYSEEDNTPCGYDCRICPIEDLIAALPDTVTENNAEEVRTQLDEILALFSNLTEDEQEQLDISRCLELQGQLDEASVPMLLADTFTMNSDITIKSSNAGQYDGKTLTGTSNSGYTLTIDGTTVNLTISGLDFTGGNAGTIVLKNGATLNLTLQGSNRLEGGGSTAGITVPEGCSFTIGGTDADSLNVLGGSGGAGIGANYYAGSSLSGAPNTVGTITINGGNITATGIGGAGIGGTSLCNTGHVIINGGTVTATSLNTSNYYAAGIGGGHAGYLESITINGGTVTAIGTSISAGIGAGNFAENKPDEYTTSCGDIRINGGTVKDTVIGYGSGNAQDGGSIIIGENADLPGCTVRPLPADYASYTFQGTVYDTSITGTVNAVFSIGDCQREVTIKVNNAEPYRGDFTVTVIMARRDAADTSLTWGGKTLTAADVPLSDTTSITFGTQEYRRYSISGTIYDGRITGNMEAAVTFLGASRTVTLMKTSDYRATFRIDNLVAATGDVAKDLSVTVTAGDITWSGTTSGDTNKTLAIGRQLYKTRLIFWDGAITEDMSVQQIQVAQNGNPLGVVEVVSGDTLHMEQVGKGYMDVWMVSGEDTGISVTVPGLNSGAPIEKTGLTIGTGSSEIEMYRGISTETPTLDLANGDVIFEGSGGSLSVTYYWSDGQEKSVTGLSYDALHGVTQSNSGTAAGNRIIVRNTTQTLHLQIENINLDRNGSPISIEAGCAVELHTKGSNTVACSSTSEPAVYVDPKATLTLSGDGTLNAKYTGSQDPSAAAIGGKSMGSSGKIIIRSGTVNVLDNVIIRSGAGIGGGNNGAGDVEIYGGIVTVVGKINGADIGGGRNGTGTVKIYGGTVNVKTDYYGAGIGGGQKGAGNVEIHGGIVTAEGYYGAGIGGGDSGAGDVKIFGGTVTAKSNKSAGVGGGRNAAGAVVTITGGSIRASSISNPTNGSESVSLVTITLPEGAVPADTPLTSAEGYGVHDVYPLDGSKFYFYLPADTLPETITVGGVDYAPESPGSTNYVIAFNVEFNGYSLTKVYDGTPMGLPAADQVTSNGRNLTFAWYQDDAAMASAPVNAGSYTLRVSSSDKGSKDFTVDIAKRPLTITVGNQTIDYNGAIEQTEYTHGELAEGDSLTVSLAASETAPGTHEGAITATAQITRNGADAAGNYNITSTPGTLTVNKAAPTVSSWPTASEITYGQALGDSNLTGGAGSVAGTFSWTAPGTKPNAGTAKFEVTFTPTDTNYDTATANVTVTVARATPTIAWSSTLQELTYTGRPANIGPVITLVNNKEYTGEIHYQWGSTSDSLVPPTDAGNYTVHASIPQQDNYTAARTTAALVLTINKADQTAPSAPTAGDGNVKDISITLDTIENAEYSRNGTTWQDSPEFTGLSPNTEYTFYARLKADKNHNASSNSNGAAIKTKKTMLDNADVTVSGTYTYDGQAKTPEITVMLNGAEIPSGEYDITYSNSAGGAGDHTSAGTVTVTVTAKDSGNYEGTATGTFRIAPAPLTVRGATAQGRAYDGTNKVAITAVTLDGIAGSDAVAVDVSGMQGTLSGANAGTYTAVRLPRLTLTGADSVNYTLVQPETAVSTSVKITPLDAVITVGTDTYPKTFGDGAFTLDVTDNNTEADVQYEVTKGIDVVDLENGTVTIRNAGTAEIIVSLPASTNFNAAENKTITVTVDKKSGYTVAALNRNYFYQDGGTDSIDIGALLPKDCGNVAYGGPAVSGNVTYSAAPAVSGGKLSYTLDSGNVNEEGTITVTVATRNFEDITVTVNVKLTDQIPVSLKTGTEVTLKNNVLTYGEPLANLVFNGAEFVGTDGKTVAGTLAWKDAAAKPNAGTTSAVWVFTPAEDKYVSLEGAAAITVNKATPAVPAAPTVAGRVYNPQTALKDIDVSGGTVTGMDGKELKGGWNWQRADIVPTVNSSGYAAVFTPEDTTNYEAVTRIITLNVTKAVPYIAGLPAAAGITYGETLKDSALSGGSVLYGDGKGQAGNGAGNTAPVTGTFTWKEPAAKPVAADSNVTEYTVVFTPSDTANYDSVEAKATLAVNKAQNAPNMPGSTMDVSNSLEKAGDVPLPEGWEWQASDRDTALEVGKPISAVAVYTGADKGNYEKETVTVTITRLAGDPNGNSYTRPIEKLPGGDTTKLGNDTAKPGNDTAKPGNDTTKPGSSQPGDTEPGSGNAEKTKPDTGIPFIKDEDGKIGWDVIRAEEEKAEEGSIINVDMNGSTVVPGDIFDSMKGKDIIITFDIGSGIIWSVDGKSITTDKAGDIDFSVKTGVSTVPIDVMNNVTGERYSIQISLVYEGEFGFTAVLSIGLGRENAGYTASLYYYNESTGELEFICADTVAEDGTVSLAFTHASDYVIVIDGEEEEESGGATEPAQPETPDGDDAGEAEESPQTGQAWRPWWLIAVGALVIVMGIGVFFVVKKKQDGE